jgi:uncharacterized integral membrane protein (TIGR00698 family)
VTGSRSLARAARHLPGLGILAAFAVAARLAAPAGLDPLVVAVAAGAFAANTVGTPRWAEPGIGLGGLLLETGIVLLGARLALEELIAAGPVVVALVVAAVLTALLLVELAGRWAVGASEPATSLLAAGAGICGVSAVVAVAGAIDADAEDVAYAAATILLFDAVTLVAFPTLGDLLALSSRQFGVWAGLAMFSTGPVAAAGFAHSTAAGEWATVTKLARNSLIGLVAVGYSFRYAHAAADDGAGTRMGTVAMLWSQFPKFLVGFVAVAAVANAGVLSGETLSSLATVSDWLFALAFVALGFDIRLDRMRTTGMAPVALVAVSLAVVGTLSLVAVVVAL